MANCLFFRGGCLAECPAELVGAEKGIVPEPARPGRGVDDPSVHLTATNELPLAVDIRGSAHVVRTTIRRSAQALDQQSVVLIIERLATQIASAAPALAQHPGRSVQRGNNKPRVIGHHRHAGDLMKVPRLGQRIFLERGVDLERVFLRPFRDSRLTEVEHRAAVFREQRTQLAKLTAASRRDQDTLSEQEPAAARDRAGPNP